MILRRIGPMSAAKINGVLCAIIGLIIGFFWSIGAVLIGAFMSRFSENQDGGLFAILFGAGAIIFLPIFYGVFGFVSGLICAWLYNLLAGWMGGIEVDFEQPTSPAPPQQT